MNNGSELCKLTFETLKEKILESYLGIAYSLSKTLVF